MKIYAPLSIIDNKVTFVRLTLTHLDQVQMSQCHSNKNYQATLDTFYQ